MAQLLLRERLEGCCSAGESREAHQHSRLAAVLPAEQLENPVDTSILIISDGTEHPPLQGRILLRQALDGMPGFRFQEIASLEELPENPAVRFQGLVLYFHHETISQAALERLEGFVREGGGLLAVHSASASFKQEALFFEILGGRFREHGPVEPFEVRPAEMEDQPFGGIPSFSVHDELYRHDCLPGNVTHFATVVDRFAEPMVWTRRLGQGRVCYCALGHTVESMGHPQVQEILRRGLAWACEGAA